MRENSGAHYLEKALSLKPLLNKKTVRPVKVTGEGEWLRDGGSLLLDFGTHLVGRITLALDCRRDDDLSPDSPLLVEFKFAEVLSELEERPYSGGMSRSWFQHETVHIDNPLEAFTLPRRYAFRYAKITFTANTSYSVRYAGCTVTAVTSADEAAIAPLPPQTSSLVRKIDETAVRTLRDCMQEVFEDGPKRDRRLWLGDLYLQARTNYYTFGNNDLVKRCLYLFAGLPHPDGLVSSAVFHEPVLRGQAWILHDYALFFIGTLADYYRATKDVETLRELWPVALRQAEAVAGSVHSDEYFHEDESIHADEDVHGGEDVHTDEDVHANADTRVAEDLPADRYFIDWCPSLDKTIPAEGVFIMMLKEASELAGILKRSKDAQRLAGIVGPGIARMRGYFRVESGLLVPASGQVSVLSQAFGVLSGVFDKATSRVIMKNTLALMDGGDIVRPVTPFAMHFLAEALVAADLRRDALKLIKDYWGGMVKEGADCFYEVYVPGNPDASPYGSPLMNSYCHAWSCTPAYFIRKYGFK